MPTRYKTITYLVFLGGLVLVAGVVAIGFLETYMAQRQAERLVVALREITVGSTERAQALDLTSPFQSHESDGTFIGLPQWIFHYDNRNLFKMHLAPYTSFDARLTFKDGVAQEKQVTVFIASGFWGSVTERKRGFGLPNGIATSEDPSHYAVSNCNSPTNVRNIRITDDDSYGETERNNDWTVKVDCLTKLGGCKDARSILPNAHSTSAIPPSCEQR
jgi:hypothetical protein